MKLTFDENLIANYTSSSQKIRVLSEGWVLREIYCPSCGESIFEYRIAENARRAGWIGSNILFSKIPKAGQIFYIENGKELAKKDVLEKWQKTVFLKKVKKTDAKGWILDIMNCVDSINKKEFTLQEVYAFESDLSVIHPENKNIKPKVRQQLQFLRDKGYLEFVGDGKYRLT